MDFDIYIRFLLALLLVLALIAALTWAARRFGIGGHMVPNTGQSPRLTIVEVKTVDPRRKLILVRRDHREHLILLGAENDLLLESGIEAPLTGAATAAKSAAEPNVVIGAPTSTRRSP